MSTRRLFMMRAIAGVAAASLASASRATTGVALAEDDPAAREFSYVSDSRRVDPKKFPEHQPGEQCLKCQIYEDGPDEMGACPLFAGKLVAAHGWCSAYN